MKKNRKNYKRKPKIVRLEKKTKNIRQKTKFFNNKKQKKKKDLTD